MDSQHSTLELAVRSRTQSAAEVREAGAFIHPCESLEAFTPWLLGPHMPLPP